MTTKDLAESFEVKHSPPNPVIREYLAATVDLSVAQLQSTMAYLADQENRCVTSLLDVLSRVSQTRGLVSASAVQHVEVENALQEISSSADEAVVALQFFDAINQRLSHILYEMNQIAEFVKNNGAHLDSDDEWRELLSAIRTKYSIGEERAVFDEVAANSVIGALLGDDTQTQDSGDDAVELF